MGENLKRQLEDCVVDISVVLFLFLLRIVISALFLYYTKKMSDDTSLSDDEIREVSELINQVDRHSKNASKIFVRCLGLLEKFFPFLIQVSICLFPQDFDWYTRPEGFPRSSTRCAQGKTPVSDFVAKVLSFRFMKHLDWTNCCVFHLCKLRGAIVQVPPKWTVTCTAAYHAAFVSSTVVRARDYDKNGPHFVDWADLRVKKDARSMVAVPLYTCKNQLIAVIGMASTAKNAFDCDRRLESMSKLLGICVNKFLSFSTRKLEIQKLVTAIISPVVSHIEHYPNIETDRCSMKPDRTKDKSVIHNKGHKISNQQDLGNGILKTKSSKGTSTDSSFVSLSSESSEQVLSISSGRYGKGSNADDDYVNCTRADQSVNWGDFFFNLVNLCFVYVYLSKVAVRGHTYLAIILCSCVGTFDVFLILIRWLWFDHCGTQGTVVLGICQIYRVIVIPVANIWMSWRVLNHLGFQSDLQYIIFLSICLLLCILLGSQVRFLLQAPLQMVSIILAALSTPDVCHRFVPLSIYPFLCLGVVSTMQLFVVYLIPTLLVQNVGKISRSGNISLRHCPLRHVVKRNASHTDVECN